MSWFIVMIISCFATTARCVVSVAKPSSTQAKYLDYEIGASIHFNMQTFNRSMRTGKRTNQTFRSISFVSTLRACYCLVIILIFYVLSYFF